MNDRDWYSPSEITYTKRECLWLILHKPLIRDGDWPPEHKVSGYSGGKGVGKKRAKFDNPACIIAELEQRVEATGLDGILLELVYQNPDDYQWLVQHISNAMHLEYRTIERRIHMALKYIAGRKRKQRSYHEFKSHKKRRPDGISIKTASNLTRF